ncbi:YgdB family protein [Pantoea dispersa]|nr:YgdB family protein [Pantoea dispersa]
MRQRGNSTLGMVVMLLLMGGLTLHAARMQLAQGMALVADEQQHQQDFWQAQAALTWGQQQNWPQAAGWQCQTALTDAWQSCLLRQEENHGLLSARGTGRALVLYQWVSLRNGQLQPQPHGWIDYCPLAKAEQCQLPETTAGF